MKFMSANQLRKKIDAKPNWALADRMHVLEEELDVKLRVVSGSENDAVDANAIANDPSVKRTIGASREDRQMGRVYAGQAALDMLRKINR